MSRTITIPAESASSTLAGFSIFPKDPAAVLDYTVDWTTWLASDTIATSNWTIVKLTPGTDATPLTAGTKSNTSATATQFVSAGTAGITYLLENTITTTGGRTAIRALEIAVSTVPQ